MIFQLNAFGDYANSINFVQSFNNNTIIFHKNHINIYNILGDVEVTINLKLIPSHFSYIKHLTRDLQVNTYTEYLFNETNAISLLNNRIQDEHKRQKIWSINNNNQLFRVKKYIMYCGFEKYDVNLLNDNYTKFNNLINLLNTYSINLNMRKSNFLTSKFRDLLFKTIGLPAHIISNTNGKELYIYMGIIPNATLVFFVELNNKGEPSAYYYELLCNESNIKSIITYDPSMLIYHNNKKYNAHNIPNTKGEYIIYLSKYFYIEDKQC